MCGVRANRLHDAKPPLVGFQVRSRCFGRASENGLHLDLRGKRVGEEKKKETRHDQTRDRAPPQRPSFLFILLAGWGSRHLTEAEGKFSW